MENGSPPYGTGLNEQEDKKMPVVEELIRTEQDGTISFGNYTLGQKAKKSDFEYQGDLYKVKTFAEITKLEKNGMFLYESVPGTAVENLKVTEDTLSFVVSGDSDAQFTVELEADTEYTVYIDEVNAGRMKTNLSGKLSVSTALNGNEGVRVKIVRA